MLSRSRRPALISFPALLVLGTVPAASAATVSLDRSCYVKGQAMTVTGSGFSPGANVTLSGGGAFGTAVADGTGAFVTQIEAPPTGTSGGRSSDIRALTLEAKNFSDSSQDTSADYRVTNFAFSVANSGGNPRKKRRFYLSGFPTGETVWAHYRFGGRTLGTVRFGKAQGPCGQLSPNMALLPASIPLKYGSWKLQWDTKRTYNARSLPRLTTVLSIFKTFSSR